MAMESHVFGPVPSRRLGRSLGIDLVPLKTCPYDCVYCQLPRTTCKTVERREWVSLESVWKELEQKLVSRPDYVTFSGSGEPTLHIGIGEIITRLKKVLEVPVAVITNGSLLWQADVRRSLLLADLVIPSLDVASENLFNSVNRPHHSLNFHQMVEGLVTFRNDFPGKYWLEIFFVKGINTAPEDIERLAGIIRRIGPDRVQLNTVVRPPVESFARPVPDAALKELALKLGENVEIIATRKPATKPDKPIAGLAELLEMMRRRPCTADDLAAGLGLHEDEVTKHLNKLVEDGLVVLRLQDDRLYFEIKQG